MLSLGILFFSSTAWSQVFIVLSPESIAGGYTIEAVNTADWGVQIPGSMMQWQGNLEFVDDQNDPPLATLACNDTSLTLANDLTGKIAMVDRGECNFTLKAYNAQKAGAIGVVICNNQPPGTTGMSAGIAASLINIPTIMIGLDDCAIIRTVVESGGAAEALIADEFTFDNDLAITQATHAANVQTPVSHIQDVVFQADISNNGSLDATSTALDVEITDGLGASVYSESITLDMGLVAGFADSTLVGVGSFTPPNCVGDYEMNWTLSGNESDDFASDNTRSNPFTISNSTFSKDNTPISGVANAVGGTYEFGNIYELLQNDEAASITFALAKNAADGTLDNESITLYLLRVDCDLTDPNCTANFDDGQVTPIGVAFYTVPPGTENYELLTADLLDWNTFQPGPLPLTPGFYIAMTSIIGDGAGNTIFTGRGSNVYYPGQLASVVREGGPLGGGNGTWFLAGFGNDTPATVRLNMTSGTDAMDCVTTGIGQVERLEANIELFPNPANQQITMDLELPTGITTAEIKISDIMGRAIHVLQVEGQSTNQVFNVDQLAQGTYFLTVSAEGKVITKRFVVTR